MSLKKCWQYRTIIRRRYKNSALSNGMKLPPDRALYCLIVFLYAVFIYDRRAEKLVLTAFALSFALCSNDNNYNDNCHNYDNSNNDYYSNSRIGGT